MKLLEPSEVKKEADRIETMRINRLRKMNEAEKYLVKQLNDLKTKKESLIAEIKELQKNSN